jgi:predicted HD superfamily hydrolase involved in NAD metabolism
MDIQQLRESMKQVLSPSRYLHSIGVEEVARDMAVIFGYEEEKAAIAGILHDCAKYLTDVQLLEQCRNYQLEVREVEKECPYLLHGKVGAVFAREKYGILDEEILNAIIYHTTGRPGMTLPEKIIFTADYIEPHRKPLPRIGEIRQAAYTDIDRGVLLILENMLDYLQKTASVIDPMTQDTLSYYQALLK